MRSWNWPWMSPHIYTCACLVSRVQQSLSVSGTHTVTGAVTVTTLPSSMRSSRALWQISRTWASGMGRHDLSCAMALRHGQFMLATRTTLHEEERLISEETHEPVQIAAHGGGWRSTVARRGARLPGVTVWVYIFGTLALNKYAKVKPFCAD